MSLRTPTSGAVRRRKGECGLWQRRFWEHLIASDDDLRRDMDYVHINPVKHGHAAKASDWPYSSIHRYIRLGWMTEDWAAQDGVSRWGRDDDVGVRFAHPNLCALEPKLLA